MHDFFNLLTLRRCSANILYAICCCSPSKNSTSKTLESNLGNLCFRPTRFPFTSYFRLMTTAIISPSLCGSTTWALMSGVSPIITSYGDRPLSACLHMSWRMLEVYSAAKHHSMSGHLYLFMIRRQCVLNCPILLSALFIQSSLHIEIDPQVQV